MFRSLWVVILALAALSGGVVTYRSFGVGKPSAIQLEAFSLPDTEGREHNINEWRGKVLVINFWATWCPPCLEEIPHFITLQESYRDRGLQFIGIAVDENESVREFSAKARFNYPNLIAGLAGAGLAASLGNPAGVVPYSVVVDREGRVVATHSGLFAPDDLRRAVTPLL
ncbi:MAG: TlpA family protein disulfide reductase [Gammaproteobacteria bacterium]